MQVVQIGDVTTGKKCWVSHCHSLLEQKTEIPNHRYAMQPRFKKSCRRFRRLFQRLKPDYALKEDYGNLDGNPTEPLLSTAIGKRLGKMLKQSPTKRIKLFYRC
jgi:hypothetical protein